MVYGPNHDTRKGTKSKIEVILGHPIYDWSKKVHSFHFKFLRIQNTDFGESVTGDHGSHTFIERN